MPATPFDRPLLSIGDRLDELRHFIAHLDSPGRRPRGAELTRTSRAWAYVAMASALESFVRDFVDELTFHINAANVPIADLKLGVVSLVEAGRFESAAATRRQDRWDRRAAILKGVLSPSVAALPAGARPLDGRTIKELHFDSLWAIYELPGSPLPSPLHAFALQDLSGGRNQVAHGDVDPVAFGRAKPYQDVVRRLGQVEDIAIHVASAGAAYIGSHGFRR